MLNLDMCQQSAEYLIFFVVDLHDRLVYATRSVCPSACWAQK